MARYKDVHYDQNKLIPVSFQKQILPGTFEYTLSYLIDHELDLSVFYERYHNDVTGAPAFDPGVLIKIVIYAYSRSITSLRRIKQACRENIIFMALSTDTQPHFTTIASFISMIDQQIVPLFRNVLLICDELKLIDGNMFAIDESLVLREEGRYTSPDFHYGEVTHTCICPAGKKLYLSGCANNLGAMKR